MAGKYTIKNKEEKLEIVKQVLAGKSRKSCEPSELSNKVQQYESSSLDKSAGEWKFKTLRGLALRSARFRFRVGVLTRDKFLPLG